jgi:tRNA-(ms[2]io[6]A)-hydroxylase
MIEARSCERFRVLSTSVDDEELRDFYNELTKTEAGHYTLFLRYAHKYGDEIMDVSKKWEEFLEFEAEVIAEYGKSARMHG